MKLPERTRIRRWSHRFAGIALATTMLATPALAATDAQEIAVKAALLFNFAKFTEWPALPPGAPLVLCVAGDDAIETALAEIVRGQKIGGRPVESRRSQDPSSWRNCHLLFVAEAEVGRGALKAVENQAVLTVSDARGFAGAGGIIELYLDGGRMRFAINVDAAARAGIVLSSRLLGLARIVRNGRAD